MPLSAIDCPASFYRAQLLRHEEMDGISAWMTGVRRFQRGQGDETHSLNDNGQVVGSSEHHPLPNREGHAFLYNSLGMTDLTPATGCCSAAWGINNADKVVGTASDRGFSNEIRLHVRVPLPPSAPAALTSVVDGSSLNLTWRNTYDGGAPANVFLEARIGAAVFRSR